MVTSSRGKKKSGNMFSQQTLISWYIIFLACGLCISVEGTITTGERPASLLVSNAIDRASTIDEPAISTPDEYKAHFIKQGKDDSDCFVRCCQGWLCGSAFCGQSGLQAGHGPLVSRCGGVGETVQTLGTGGKSQLRAMVSERK